MAPSESSSDKRNVPLENIYSHTVHQLSMTETQHHIEVSTHLIINTY